jgi:hypothetical protein
LAEPAVEHGEAAAVETHMAIVMKFADGELGGGTGVQPIAVKDEAVVLAVGFHRARLHVANGAREVFEQRGGFGEGEARDGDGGGGRRGHGRQRRGRVFL